MFGKWPVLETKAQSQFIAFPWKGQPNQPTTAG